MPGHRFILAVALGLLLIAGIAPVYGASSALISDSFDARASAWTVTTRNGGAVSWQSRVSQSGGALGASSPAVRGALAYATRAIPNHPGDVQVSLGLRVESQSTATNRLPLVTLLGSSGRLFQVSRAPDGSLFLWLPTRFVALDASLAQAKWATLAIAAHGGSAPSLVLALNGRTIYRNQSASYLRAQSFYALRLGSDRRSRAGLSYFDDLSVTRLGASPIPPPPSPTPPSSPPPSPSASPSPPPSPSASPSPPPSPSASPSPPPSPTPLFNFWGRGTDHGVGMSQWGAKGRAVAGQSYDQILHFYYTNVEISSIDASAPIRVLLGSDFTPSATYPARITAANSSWTSPQFAGTTFAPGGYVEMWPTEIAPPTPSPSINPSLSPSISPSAAPSDSPIPTPGPSSSPTPSPSGSPPPDPSPTPSTSPAPSPSTSPSPTPSLSPLAWVAIVYDAAGVELARTPSLEVAMTPLDSTNGISQLSFLDAHPAADHFRGTLRMFARDTGLYAVNTLPIDQYLLGVVPSEMPGSWPLEALKAQAVAARSYAWPRIGGEGDWDVRPTSANQNYKGYDHEYPKSTQAVDATAGQVLTYNGRVIAAYYHSAAGGWTENSEYAFVTAAGNPGSAVGYARGKADVDADGLAYDRNAPSYYWETVSFTMDELSAIMALNDKTNVGQIVSLSFTRGVSGRAYQVVLVGTLGTKTVNGGVFSGTFNTYRPGGVKILSNMFYLVPFGTAPGS